MKSQIPDSLSGESVLPPTIFLDLNDYIVRKVFDHLDNADLYTAAEVSTNFKQNAQMIFQRRYKTDRFNISVRGNDETICRERSEVHLRRLPSVLRNFGSWTNSIGIILGNRVRKHSQKVFKLVSHYCGATLNEICLAQFKLTNELVPDLRPLLKRLQKLELYWCWWDSTFVASEMFSFCTEMHSLTITNYWNCEPFYQSLIFPKLQTFDLISCYVSSDEMMDAFLKNHPQMLGLTIMNCSGITRKMFQTLAENIPKIESLTFLCNGLAGELVELKRLTELKVLKIDCSLHVQHITSVLDALARANSPLESLLLYSSYWTEGLITALARLQRLKELEITGSMGLNSIISDFEPNVQELSKFSRLQLSVKTIGVRSVVQPDAVDWFPGMFVNRLSFLSLGKEQYLWHHINHITFSYVYHEYEKYSLIPFDSLINELDALMAEDKKPRVGFSANDLDTELPYPIVYMPMPKDEECRQMKNAVLVVYEKKGNCIHVTSRNETHIYPCA